MNMEIEKNIPNLASEVNTFLLNSVKNIRISFAVKIKNDDSSFYCMILKLLTFLVYSCSHNLGLKSSAISVYSQKYLRIYEMKIPLHFTKICRVNNLDIKCAIVCGVVVILLLKESFHRYHSTVCHRRHQPRRIP